MSPGPRRWSRWPLVVPAGAYHVAFDAREVDAADFSPNPSSHSVQRLCTRPNSRSSLDRECTRSKPLLSKHETGESNAAVRVPFAGEPQCRVSQWPNLHQRLCRSGEHSREAMTSHSLAQRLTGSQSCGAQGALLLNRTYAYQSPQGVTHALHQQLLRGRQSLGGFSCCLGALTGCFHKWFCQSHHREGL